MTTKLSSLMFSHAVLAGLATCTRSFASLLCPCFVYANTSYLHTKNKWLRNTRHTVGRLGRAQMHQGGEGTSASLADEPLDKEPSLSEASNCPSSALAIAQPGTCRDPQTGTCREPQTGTCSDPQSCNCSDPQSCNCSDPHIGTCSDPPNRYL